MINGSERTLRMLVPPIGSFLLVFAAQASAQDKAAVKVVEAGLAAQGGEATLRSLRSVAWDSVGYRNELEQSERPEGPYVTEFTASSEVHDLAGARWSALDQATVYPAWTGSQRTVVANGAAMLASGGRQAPGTTDDVAYARERMALSPERLLLTAKASKDLMLLPDVVLQSVPHHVVRFSLDGAPVTVFLNADTHLPTAWEYTGPFARRAYWRFAPGQVVTRTTWGFWWIVKQGIRMPMQWTVTTNGLPDRMFSIKRLTIDAPLDEATLSIPASIRAAYEARPAPIALDDRPLGSNRPEIRPGVILIEGSWNVTIVRQDDGIVIIEAPISSVYSAKVMAEARRRFPGVPIKAVVTTSDAWPHIAGIREYAAAGVPIYALDRNRPILERWVSTEGGTEPGSSKAAKFSPRFHFVTRPTKIGRGVNRLVLYPIRGETSERQMMAFFPQHRVLYGSDPFQRGPDRSYFFPQTVSEVTDAVTREHLDVETFYMMHLPPAPWPDLQAVVSEAASEQTPDGEL